MNDANKALVITAYRRGHTVAAICEAAGMSTRTLYRLLEAEGVPLRGPAPTPRRTPVDPAERVEAELLAAHEAKHWLCESEVMRRTGATASVVGRVRNELQEQGRVGTRADYAVCYICGKPAVARAMCHTHYREARLRQAQRNAPSVG
jgi:hypothetical protein